MTTDEPSQDMDTEYLDRLNPQQREAVTYCDAPQLVIAGAGSGKTRVLTYKIVHLLTLGYEPWRIIALTFTNKAAREMRSRIEELVGPSISSKLWMGTFHSLFSRILRVHAERIGFKSNYTIYDSADSKSLVKSIIKDLELDDKIYKPVTVQNAISTAKNALISPEEYRRLPDLMEADRRARRQMTAEIYRIYRDRCHGAGAMDFDDLLYYTNVLLRDNPDILHHYQEYFRYILVDEYQDTNFAQHAIITRLSETTRKLCVVGDDAQSIYSFRGANIRNILNLKNVYPDLRTFKLERNYRSTRNIIEAAGSLIDKNTQQIRKHVFSENDPGNLIEVARSFSDFEEAFLVANRISRRKMETGESYDEFAILYRTNAQSRVLEESLRKRNIPYRIYGGLSFYQRKEIKDAIAYFRLSINPDDDEALRRVINFPARGIGETTLNRLARAAMDRSESLWSVICGLDEDNAGLASAAVGRLKAFRTLIEGFAEAAATGDAETTATLIIRQTGLLSMLISDRTPESISKRENLEELLAGVKQFVAGRREEGSDATSLTDFLSEVSLATDQDSEDSADEPKVTLMTVHAAKGLEFGNVFIVGVEMDLFPSAMAQNSVYEIEEERRLLYVAITRAKRFCMMSYATSRFRAGQTVTCSPSPFLRDIDSCYLRHVSGADAGETGSGGYPVDPAARWYRSEALGRSGSTSKWTRSGSNRGSGPALRTLGPTDIPPAPAPAAADGFRAYSASELCVGTRVNHRTFGSGVITEIDSSGIDHKITVDFDNTGSKRLLLKFARLQIID